MHEFLLVASDLAPRSLPPLARALALAAAVPGRRVGVVHVLDEGTDARLHDGSARAAVEAIDRAARRIAWPGAPEPEILVRTGEPAATILAVAHEREADLVLTGTPRPRRLLQGFAGSTVERVIRAGVAPVLLARLPDGAPWRRVILATDLSETAGHAVRTAARLGLLAGVQAELVQAFRPRVPGTAGFGEAGSDAIARAAAAERAALVGDLRAFAATLPEGLRAEPVLLEGQAAAALIAHAAATRAGLIVTGTRGRSGLAGLVLGSTARELLAGAPCDVLAVAPAPA